MYGRGGRRASTLALAALVLTAGSPAHAQGRAPRCDANVAYGALAEQASKLSRDGQLEAALATYQAAYQQCADPRLLYNTARLLHRLGRPAKAVDYYERFLASKDESDPERLIQVREYLLQARREAGLVSQPAPAPSPDRTSGEQTQRDQPSSLAPTPAVASVGPAAVPSRFPTPAVVLLAGGAGLLAAGLGLGGATLQASRDLVTGDGPFDAALYSRAQSMNVAGIALDSIGGVALTGGIIWSIVWAAKRPKLAMPTPAQGSDRVSGTERLR